jgi:nitroreductase
MNPRLQFVFARRSVRNFVLGKPVPDTLLQDLLEAGMAAPSAAGKDPWHFIILDTPELRARIAEGLPNGKMLAQAGSGLVICGDLQKAHGGELSFLLQDCSAAIENILLAAAALGLGACWLGVHPRPERIEHLRRICALPDNIVPVGAIALGWPAETPPARTRYTGTAVHRGRW